MALGKKIIKLRNERGLKQTQLIQLLKTHLPDSEHEKLQGAISNLEQRDSKTSKYTSLIAKVLNVSIESLINDNYSEESNSQNNFVQEEAAAVYFSRTINKVDTNVCPVISWVQAGELCLSEFVLNFDDAIEWRFCPVKHSEKCFVLAISGTSMEPEYTDGSEIFVDPTIEPLHNDDVVVCDAEGRATFKRLKITHEGKYLEALNPDFPNRIIKVPDGTIICGVVIYSGRKRR